MKIIEEIDEALEEMKRQIALPPGVMNTSGYGPLVFECGCGAYHGVNDPSVEQILCFRPIKILFKCKSHYTKVRIKGFISQKCISEWTFKNELLDDYVEEKEKNL